MTQTHTLTQTDLPYQTEFAPHELNAMKACCDAHGFAIVKSVLPLEYVEELKTSMAEILDPENNIKPGETRYDLAIVEKSPTIWKLFLHENWLRIQQHFAGTDQLSVHRSAALLKAPGAPPMEWHSDWMGHAPGPPRDVDGVLNTSEAPSGMWFYLTGTHPEQGGLGVIADSHEMDWPGPEGFELFNNRRMFHPRGEEVRPYSEKDVPGTVALVTDPGDLIIFAARTFHGVFPHNGNAPRMSCGIGLRDDRVSFNAPWPLPESAQQFKEIAPDYLRPYLEHYPGMARGWTADEQ